MFLPFWWAMSDPYGRHVSLIASCIGAIMIKLVYTSILLAPNLPLWILIIGDSIHGVFAKSINGIILVASSTISDIMQHGNRTFLMIIMDLILTLAITTSQIVGGYWIKSSGFIPILVTSISLAFLLLLYSIIIMPRILSPPPGIINPDIPFVKQIINPF